MKKTMIKLSLEKMQQLARYEITMRDIKAKFHPDKYQLSCSKTYPMTLDDLTAAIENIVKRNPTVKELVADWYFPMDRMAESFQIWDACGRGQNRIVPIKLKPIEMLSCIDSDYFDKAWFEIEQIWLYEPEDKCAAERLQPVLEKLKRYQQNKNKPLSKWTLTTKEMKRVVSHLRGIEIPVSKNALKLYHKIVDALCEEGDIQALEWKAYSCYGGNHLYDCDWCASRDCLLKLYELTSDVYYANSLGYIFYYGRCTNGEPEYDKAFYYFNIAANFGVEEAVYKLGDMYANGYGCQKNEYVARELYQRAYKRCLKAFLKGDHSKFADTALRMGHIYARGIGTEPDVKLAYTYYLQAEYAINLRSERDYYGDNSVRANIAKAKSEVRCRMDASYFCQQISCDNPMLLKDLTSQVKPPSYRCRLIKRKLENGNIELIARRLPESFMPNPPSILVTLSQLDFCSRNAEFKMTAVAPEECWFRYSDVSIDFNYISRNSEEKRYEFYLGEKLMAWIQCQNFRISKSCADCDASNREYAVVSVKFGSNGQVYDYLCELKNVHVGDVVYVNGYQGETPVTVVAFGKKRESDLPVPLERMKTVIRKA